MKSLDKLQNNIQIIQGILRLGDPKKINAQLDQLLNTVHITYKSKKDFVENFPDEDDIKGKIKLILSRRK